MLFNLLLANIPILLSFYFLFRVNFNNFFTIPVEMKNTRLKLALAIPTGAPMKVANDAIEMLPLVADKTNKDLSKQSKEPIYLLSLLLINSVSLISATKQCLPSLILFSLNCY